MFLSEDELYNLILERYTLDELLETVELSLGDFLAVWDGWVGHPAILSDLGFEVEDTDDSSD